MNTLNNFAKSVFPYIFAKQYILKESPDHVLLKWYMICSYFKSLKIFWTAILEPLRSHFAKITHKVAKSKYFDDSFW